MSFRNYKSGAQKRKDKSEKDGKEQDLMTKVPKISDIFKKKDEESETSHSQILASFFI